MNPLSQQTNNPQLTQLWYAGMQALEVLGIGWLLCDATGRVLDANPTASGILGTGNGPRPNYDGAPCAHQGCSDLLAEAVRQAARASRMEEQERPRAAFIVRRVHGKQAIALLVRAISTVSMLEYGARSAFLVLILDSSLSIQATAGELRRLCGFTPDEEHLANLLMDNLSLDDCSARLGISRASAAARLRRMFKKTGVHRQTELVSALLKTIGLVRLRSEKIKLLTRLSEELLEKTVSKAPLSTSDAHHIAHGAWVTRQ
jgi:DNA-binding CsgD family transcriptional regulator